MGPGGLFHFSPNDICMYACIAAGSFVQILFFSLFFLSFLFVCLFVCCNEYAALLWRSERVMRLRLERSHRCREVTGCWLICECGQIRYKCVLYCDDRCCVRMCRVSRLLNNVSTSMKTIEKCVCQYEDSRREDKIEVDIAIVSIQWYLVLAWVSRNTHMSFVPRR